MRKDSRIVHYTRLLAAALVPFLFPNIAVSSPPPIDDWVSSSLGQPSASATPNPSESLNSKTIPAVIARQSSSSGSHEKLKFRPPIRVVAADPHGRYPRKRLSALKSSTERHSYQRSQRRLIERAQRQSLRENLPTLDPDLGTIGYIDTHPNRTIISCSFSTAQGRVAGQDDTSLGTTNEQLARIRAILATNSNTLTQRHTFQHVFCGLSISGKLDQAIRRQLEQEGFRIHPVKRYETTLDRSVLVTGATKLWQQVDSSSRALTGKGQRIGVIDTGIDYGHPDFGSCSLDQLLARRCASINGGYDFVNNDSDPYDDNGHGTHVASIIGSRDASFRGVAPDATLFALKVLTGNGYGWDDDIIAALEFSADPNGDGDTVDQLDVVNLSLGGFGSPDDALSTACDNLMRLGTVVVVAAGNSGNEYPSVNCPGCAREVVTVGASELTDVGTTPGYGPQAWFSSRGPFEGESGGTIGKPDLSAPGVAICAALAQGYTDPSSAELCTGRQHHKLSGTSMAAPHVAGLAALVRQKFPQTTPQQIKAILKSKSRLAPGSSLENGGFGNISIAELSQSDLSTPAVNLSSVTNVPGSIHFNVIAEVSSPAGIRHVSVQTLPVSAQERGEQTWQTLWQQELADTPVTFELREVVAIPQATAERILIRIVASSSGPVAGSAWSSVRLLGPSILWPPYGAFVAIGKELTISSAATLAGQPVDYLFRKYPHGPEQVIRNNRWTPTEHGAYELIARQQVVGGEVRSSRVVKADSSIPKGFPLQGPSDNSWPFTGFANLSFTLARNAARLPIVAGINTTCSDFSWNDPLESCLQRGFTYEENTAPRLQNRIEPAGMLLPLSVSYPIDNRVGDFIFRMLDCSPLRQCKIQATFASSGLPVPGWDNVPVSNLVDWDKPSVHVIPGPPTAPQNFRVLVVARYLDGQIGAPTPPARYSVFNANGTLAASWSNPNNYEPVFHFGRNRALPAIGNFDEDDDLEFAHLVPDPEWIAGTNERSLLYVYNLDGTVVPGWPQRLAGSSGFAPVVAGDISGDSRDEVITQTGCVDARQSCEMTYAFSADGTILPGWPTGPGLPIDDFSHTSLALADFTGDGHPEILSCFYRWEQRGSSCRILNRQGILLPGSPFMVRGQTLGEPHIVNLDDSNSPEILFAVWPETQTDPRFEIAMVVIFDKSGRMLPALGRDLPFDVGAKRLSAWGRDGSLSLILSPFNSPGFYFIGDSPFLIDRGVQAFRMPGKMREKPDIHWNGIGGGVTLSGNYRR